MKEILKGSYCLRTDSSNLPPILWPPLAPHPLPPVPPLYLPKSMRRSAEADRDTPLHTACLTGSYDQVYTTYTMTSSWKHL